MKEYIEREKVRDIIADAYKDATDGEAETVCIGINSMLMALPAADAIDALSKPGWIPVEEKLPEQPGDYIVFLKSPEHIRKQWLEYGLDDDGSYVTTAFYNDSQRIWEMENDAYNTDLSKVNMDDDYAITHWIPLPEPPKEEGET